MYITYDKNIRISYYLLQLIRVSNKNYNAKYKPGKTLPEINAANEQHVGA
jgi:hypothetical protein